MRQGLAGNSTVKLSYLKMGKRAMSAVYWLVKRVAVE